MLYDQDRDKEAKVRLQEIMNKYNIKQVEVARETGKCFYLLFSSKLILCHSGIHHSSLSLWLQGKIKGHVVKITETIENYLENFMSNKPRMNTVHISKLSLLKASSNRGDVDQEMINYDSTQPSALTQNTNQPNLQLIPIKLDFEIEGVRLRDLFLWDKNEPYLSLDGFAKILMEEHNLPATFEQEIVGHLKKQINQFKVYKQMDGELVKIIQLNVRIGNIVLRDQFEWDINNPHNSPEDFAESLCSDLGLGAEFMLPIAHSIREQINEHQRLAHQERRGGYQHFANHGRDYKNSFKNRDNEREAPGKDLGEIRDLAGRPILNDQELQQTALIQETNALAGIEQSTFQPQKTMLRSLDELYQPRKEVVNKFFQPSPMDEPFQGWAPDIQILNENELKKIERQEERQQRYRNRGQRK